MAISTVQYCLFRPAHWFTNVLGGEEILERCKQSITHQQKHRGASNYYKTLCSVNWENTQSLNCLFLVMLTPYLHRTQALLIYLANPFLFYFRRRASTWSMQESGRDISLLSGICHVNPCHIQCRQNHWL